MRSIRNIRNLNNKKIILRLDLNVPLKNGKILDTTRVDKILKTLKYLLKYDLKIIILSHIGRPKGKSINKFSLKPLIKDLQKKLKRRVILVTKNVKHITDKNFFNKFKEKIIVLENIRFYPEEEKNDNKFAKHLAGLGDIYVNDAFSCSHRAHSSINKITKFLPSYSGLQFDSEINALKKITSEIKKPITCIIGGSKISTKINIIKNLIPKFDNIIIVGGMANNIIEFMGNNIGKSIREKKTKKIIKEIFFLAKKQKCKIIYPVDVIVANNLTGSPRNKRVNDILFNEMILDIGPITIKEICKIIDMSKTILWNGPAGYFENPNFARGSVKIAKKIIKNNKKIYSVAGGGDTVSLLKSLNATRYFNFISTAGGAFLEYLEGKVLPGIKTLK